MEEAKLRNEPSVANVVGAIEKKNLTMLSLSNWLYYGYRNATKSNKNIFSFDKIYFLLMKYNLFHKKLFSFDKIYFHSIIHIHSIKIRFHSIKSSP